MTDDVAIGSTAPELGFTKTKNTAGTVEVHVDALSRGTYERVLDAISDFQLFDVADRHYQLFGSANGAPQLVFIKTKNTAGTVDVHADALSAALMSAFWTPPPTSNVRRQQRQVANRYEMTAYPRDE